MNEIPIENEKLYETLKLLKGSKSWDQFFEEILYTSEKSLYRKMDELNRNIEKVIKLLKDENISKKIAVLKEISEDDFEKKYKEELKKIL